jgi:DNA-binding LacI/PurR family transcriptional regulator
MPASRPPAPLTPRPVTIRDVATAAALDPSTVSRALTGKRGVSPSTRALVERTAERMGSQPHALAQGLRTHRSGIVGLVVPDIRNEWYTTLAAVMEPMLARWGYLMQLSVSRDDEVRERQAVRLLADHQAVGVILAPRGRHLPAVPGLGERLPVVEVSRYTDAPTDKVYADDETGTFDALAHLLGLGHRRIGLITNARGLTTTQNRIQGYTRALHAAGLIVDRNLFQPGQNSIEWGCEAMNRFLRLRERPTAIVAGGHLITLGVLESLAERGLGIPRDVSLVTFDDTAWAAAWSGGITALRAPWPEMAEAAVDLLRQRIEIALGHEPARAPVVRVFPYEMMIRGSSAPPAAGAGSDAGTPAGSPEAR